MAEIFAVAGSVKCVFDVPKDAEKKAEEYQKNKDTKDITFRGVATRYLTLEESRISEPQLNTKKSRIEYFYPYIGEKNITDITPEDIQYPIAVLTLANPKTHKPTAKRTLARYLDSIDNVFCFALKNRMISSNPCDFVSTNQNAPQKERTSLTEEEREAIENCKHDRAWIAVVLMYTGLRRGEATALTWKDVNLEEKTITINKSFDYKEYRVKPPKTKSGFRVVPIPDKIIPILKAHKGKKNEYVFLNACGDMIGQNSWKKLRAQIVKATGVDFSWHQLRHTYASVLYSAGVDVLTACKILGHSDVKTTMSIYTHLEEKTRSISIAKLNKHLSENNT